MPQMLNENISLIVSGSIFCESISIVRVYQLYHEEEAGLLIRV